jgi:hypothetical protein
MKNFKEIRQLAEEKRGLYANIHAKPKRGEETKQDLGVEKKITQQKMLSKKQQELLKKKK